MFGDELARERPHEAEHVAGDSRGSATELACPPNPYIRPTVAPAICEGTDELNGFYGHGEINALAAIGG